MRKSKRPKPTHVHDGKTPCPGCGQKAGIDLALARCKAHGRYALSIADEVGGFTGAYIGKGCEECMSEHILTGPSGKWEHMGTWWLDPQECVMLGMVLTVQSGATLEQLNAAKAQVESTYMALEAPPH